MTALLRGEVIEMNILFMSVLVGGGFGGIKVWSIGQKVRIAAASTLVLYAYLGTSTLCYAVIRAYRS